MISTTDKWLLSFDVLGEKQQQQVYLSSAVSQHEPNERTLPLRHCRLHVIQRYAHRN